MCEEFDDYKTLTDEEVDIESCLVDIEYKDIFRSQVKKKGTKGHLQSPTSEYGSRFRLLTKVASISLVIPYSNTDEGKIFSSVRKYKTDFRQSMELDRTLSSFLVFLFAN